MTILLAQVVVQLIESFFLRILPLLKLFQLVCQMVAMILSQSFHFEIIAPSKATPHDAGMLLYIIDSALIQFALEVKPFIRGHKIQDSDQMNERANNQDY